MAYACGVIAGWAGCGLAWLVLRARAERQACVDAECPCGCGLLDGGAEA